VLCCLSGTAPKNARQRLICNEHNSSDVEKSGNSVGESINVLMKLVHNANSWFLCFPHKLFTRNLYVVVIASFLSLSHIVSVKLNADFALSSLC
jgi:hypothetical protein